MTLQSKEKDCNKPQALRATAPLTVKAAATGQILPDGGSNVYKNPEILVRDWDLEMLVEDHSQRSLQPRNLLLHPLTRVCTLCLMHTSTIEKRDPEWIQYWVCNTSTLEKIKSCQTITFNMRGSRETVFMSLQAPWLKSRSQHERIKALRIFQGVPLWMMGSLGGRQRCLSINWINGQWRLAFLALQRQELTVWEQKN